MGKKRPRKYWYEYYLSFHLGFCHGPCDALTAIYMKEKEAWKGEVYGNTVIDINKRDLFGGEEREGGVSGHVHVMLGSQGQLIPSALASRLGRTPETAPGFRLTATLAFLGRSLGSGFYVGANYPHVPNVWARFRRAPKTFGGNPVIINELGFHDANPAHIIHECLVDKDFGMGAPEWLLDQQSFAYAAQVLADEKFGLSLLWTQQTTIEAFIQEILDHIKGMFFFNPRTGLGTLRLLRNDYDPNNLPHIGPDEADLDTFRRKLWGETVNEIIISWTNPEKEETETITYHDPANIAMQGEVVSENRHYYGIRSAELASFVGARDIVEASTPLATAQIRVNRRKWDILPGDVVKFSWPKYNIDQLIMRVMEVDYGKPDDAEMKLTLIEDIFGLEHATFLDPPRTEWRDPDQDPNEPPYDLVIVAFFALPYPLVVDMVGSENISDERYPDILIGTMVFPRPVQTDFQSFVLWDEDVDATGTLQWFEAGEKQTTGSTFIGSALQPEVESVIILDMESATGPTQPEVGGLGMFIHEDGSGWERREFKDELVLFLEDLGNNAWRVARGVLDTIPHHWPRGTRIAFIDASFDAVDLSPELADVDNRYKIQPRTSLGKREFLITEPVATNRPARPYMPFRPANVHVDGVMFDVTDHSKNYNPRNWTIETWWSNRNRFLEETVYRRWDDATVSMEDGQTVELCFWWSPPGEASEDERRVKGLTGTSYSIDVFKTGQVERIPIKFVSKRDDLESLQGYETEVILYRKGFGSDWGYFYGGWDPDFEVGEPTQETE